VRIRHINGFSTIYAHLNLALVHAGQDVRAGDRIGLSDTTGNSTRSHLHLTLKKEGATLAGLTKFPNDIVDPTPYLVYSANRVAPLPSDAQWPYQQCLVGLHGRTDGPMTEADWKVVQTAHVE